MKQLKMKWTLKALEHYSVTTSAIRAVNQHVWTKGHRASELSAYTLQYGPIYNAKVLSSWVNPELIK